MNNRRIGMQTSSYKQGFIIIGDIQICWGNFGATSGGGTKTWWYPKEFDEVFAVSRTSNAPASTDTAQYRSSGVENVETSYLDFQVTMKAAVDHYFIVIGRPVTPLTD